MRTLSFRASVLTLALVSLASAPGCGGPEPGPEDAGSLDASCEPGATG